MAHYMAIRVGLLQKQFLLVFSFYLLVFNDQPLGGGGGGGEEGEEVGAGGVLGQGDGELV